MDGPACGDRREQNVMCPPPPLTPAIDGAPVEGVVMGAGGEGDAGSLFAMSHAFQYGVTGFM